MSKSCYGNYLLEGCENNHDCKEESYCMTETFIKHGVCDCIYKGSCHLFRQQCQVNLRKNNPTYNKVEQCDIFIILKEMQNENSQKS